MELLNRPLTSRQAQVVIAIRDLTAKLGMPPTIKEIREAVGVRANSTVAFWLQSLERKGYIRRNRPDRAAGIRRSQWSRARGILLTEKANETQPAPTVPVA